MALFHGGRRRAVVRRFVAVGVAVLGLAFLVVPVPAEARGVSCRDLNVPVSLLGLPQTMYGKLCIPAHGSKTVQILIPGGTYNGSYWDIAYTPDIRSYRIAMNKAGYATLTLDRLGTGRSSTPPSVLLTATTEALSVHHVIKALRAGMQGPRFDKVILGGHSLGSAIAIIEAATFHDVDGVLLTGLAHRMKPVGTARVVASTVPAALDAKFAYDGHDPGYLTTMSGTRYSIFHSPGPEVPGAIAYDESTKDTSVITQLVDVSLLGVVTPYTRLIHVPVMLALGDDPIFCGVLASDCSSAETLRLGEAMYFSPTARLETYVLHGYGHAINYAPNAPNFHRAVAAWADTMVGR